MRPTTMRAKTWGPVATFVAVAAVGTTVALVGTGGGSGDPRPLGLTSGAAKDAQLGAPTAAGGSGTGYELTGTLSAEKPSDAPVWKLAQGAAPEDVVTRLAKALDAGDPKRDGKGWRAGGLVVSGDAGQSWFWYPCGGGKDTAVSSDGTASSTCATDLPVPQTVPGSSGSGSSGTVGSGSAGSSTQAVPPVETVPSTIVPTPVPVVSEAVVKDGAQEVLRALGYDVSDARIDTFPGGGSATVEPTLGGLQTSGFATRVDVDAASRVTGASGYLAAASKGDEYPLMSAKDAFADMPQLGRPDICQLPPDGSSGCVEPAPVQITGATLGLSLQQTQDGNLLVPSWLYTVKDGQPIAAVAVEKAYQQPADRPTDTPGTPGTTDPGTTEPGTGVDPAPPTASRWPVMLQSAKAGKGNEIVLTYDNGGCGEKNVTGFSKEDPETVYVGLEADARPSDQACTEDYRPATITLQLQAPLGDRKVVNANATSVEVPRESS